MIEINGLKVRADIHVSDTGFVNRTWRERLFERPWRPCKKTKSIYEPRVYLMDGVALVSPQTFSILKREGRLDTGQIIGPIIDAQMAKAALTKGECK